MGRLELFDELAKACGSTALERQLDLYLERSISKDKGLESDIRKVCLNLADSIKETEAIAKECDVMKETELSQREKDLFGEKLKGWLPF
ncbi:hypothetical protein CTI12_AA208490 [Artemisia annua]|uniref:Uncharacterized protein n=1 Tax=Artemisia annua TaxID=35608 RepID=A0A2U1P0B2_ARTAN|nr:hypothetical protein CTI12_AA208490 [Artemisia annua]